MEYVDPITNPRQLQKMSQILYDQSPRNYLMFMIGINVGLRISDYLSKDVGYFKDAAAKGYVELRPEKTKRYGKNVRVYMSQELIDVINDYTKLMENGELMFTSRTRDRDGNPKPISRQQAWNIINDAAREAGINDNMGCHSMRKTFGYWHYQKNHDIRLLMAIFNHATEAITLRYIGITNDNIKNSMQGMNLGIVRRD